jgi:hypothetical protein
MVRRKHGQARAEFDGFAERHALEKAFVPGFG